MNDGGRLVDDLTSTATAQVDLPDQNAFDRRRRQPLIPESQRRVDAADEIPAKLTNRLAASALPSVHADRQADDEAADLKLRAVPASRSRSRPSRLRKIVSHGLAIVRLISASARPIVLVPTSRPRSRLPEGSSAGSSTSATSGINRV